MRVRQARESDYDDVVAFTTDTWSDRREDAGDYIPYVFEEWVETDGPRQRTLVADPRDEAGIAGIAQFVLLSDHEAWAQGMRANPEFRGRGVGLDLAHAGFDWAREQGAAVARNMVFSWNVMGLGHSRAAGFAPCTEFRWVHPEPDAVDDPSADADANTAWAFWQRSHARDHLRGLALASEETWALRELTRADLAAAADEGDLLVTDDDGGTSGFALHTRTTPAGEEGNDVARAEYGVAVWRDGAACRDVLDAIRADAAARDADETRVLVPETVDAVSDVAVTRTAIGEEPDFVMEADLTEEYRNR